MAYEPGDLAIKIDGYKLNIRAAGVIIHNEKYGSRNWKWYSLRMD